MRRFQVCLQTATLQAALTLAPAFTGFHQFHQFPDLAYETGLLKSELFMQIWPDRKPAFCMSVQVRKKEALGNSAMLVGLITYESSFDGSSARTRKRACTLKTNTQKCTQISHNSKIIFYFNIIFIIFRWRYSWTQDSRGTSRQTKHIIQITALPSSHSRAIVRPPSNHFLATFEPPSSHPFARPLSPHAGGTNKPHSN